MVILLLIILARSLPNLVDVTNDSVGEGPVTVAEGHTAHEIQACAPHSNAQLLPMARNGPYSSRTSHPSVPVLCVPGLWLRHPEASCAAQGGRGDGEKALPLCSPSAPAWAAPLLPFPQALRL